jgi:WhiB family transcriptional regulator, redox-sensing transcriptional regulator
MRRKPVRDLDWQTRAACRDADLDLFYSADPAEHRQAVRMCRGCPVRRPCFEAAVERGEVFGVWGGTTERERRRILREIARRGETPTAA